MTRSDQLESGEGEERLRRLSISVVRTLWGDGHEGRCTSKGACALCLAAAEDGQQQQRAQLLRARAPSYPAARGPPDYT